MFMLISVIIPTRNRCQSLATLLDSIEGIKLAAGVSAEFIVVNNASTDCTANMLRDREHKSPQITLKIIEQAVPGKSRALNRALTESCGQVLAILDDDVIVDEHCLAKHVEAYQQTDFAAVQGRVLPGNDPKGRSADPDRLQEYNIPLIDYGDEYREIRGLIGTNMSFKREVLDTVGLFDPRLGPGASGFSEDTEFSARIRKAGFKIGYTPHAIVYHELNPARYGRAYNRNVEYRKGLSRSIYRNDSIAFRVVPDFAINCIRYSHYSFLGHTQKAYKTEGRILKCWGQIVGTFQSRRKRKLTT